MPQMDVSNPLRRFLPDFNLSYDPYVRPYLRIITISAFSLAIGIGFALKNYIVFEFHDSSGVVGWISVNQYPKQQEFFYYLLAIVGIPTVICLYWTVWLTYSQWISKVTKQPIQNVLRANASASVPLWLCWLQVFYLDQQGLIWVIIPIVITVSLKLVFLFFRFDLYSSKHSIEPTKRDLQQNVISSFLPRQSSIFRFGFSYFIVPIFIYLLMYNSNINGGIDMFHEGERLAPLNEMMHGGVVFRDVYVQHGLFQNAYLAWFGSKLFEPTLMGVRAMERILGPLGYVAIYLLGLQVFRGRMITAFICFLIVSGSSFNVSPRHSLGLISFAFIANYLTCHSINRINVLNTVEGENKCSYRSSVFIHGSKLIFSGIFTSLAFWYSTEVGLYTLAAITIFLIIYSIQLSKPLRIRSLPLISYVIGLLLGFLPIAIYFLSHGALDEAIWNSYIQCKYQLSTWGLKFPSLFDTLSILTEQGMNAFLFDVKFRWYLPIFVFVVTGAYLTYRRLSGRSVFDEDSLKLLLLLLGGIAFFRTALGRSDGGHLNYGSTFLWLLLLFPFDRSISGIFHRFYEGIQERGFLNRISSLIEKMRWQRVVKPICLLLIPLVICSWYVGEVHNPISSFRGKVKRVMQNPFKRSLPPVELERAGQVDIPDNQVEQIQNVVAFIHNNTAPDEKIFDFTSQGAYYFFANRPSVTRFHMVSYASTPGMQKEVVSALKKDLTRLVIFKTGGWFDNVDGIPVEERHPIIAQYLEDNYKHAIDINGTEILMRK